MDNGIKDSKEISHDRVTKEREFEDDCCIHLVLFTAGTAVLMACLKKVLVVFLLEKWRAWVFVLLNLVLLAILFTSTLSKPKESQKESNNVEVKIERSKKLRRKHSKCWSEQVTKREESEECPKTSGKLSSTNGCGEEDREIEPPRLSKEELNERAEAFIVMFRRHLVSDARKCGKEYLFERLERVERVEFQALAK